MQVVQFAPKEKKKAPVNLRPLHVYAATAVVAAGLLAAVTLFFNLGGASTAIAVRPVTAESYLIESALGEPADMAEAMVYEK